MHQYELTSPNRDSALSDPGNNHLILQYEGTDGAKRGSRPLLQKRGIHPNLTQTALARVV